MSRRSLKILGSLLLSALLGATAALWIVPSETTHAQGRGPKMPPPGGDIDGDGVPNIEDSDMDGDGLTNEYERDVTGTDETLADTDGDSLSDAEEIIPTDFSPTGEPLGKTDPQVDDSDNDGWTDGIERAKGTDPNDPNRTPEHPFGRR